MRQPTAPRFAARAALLAVASCACSAVTPAVTFAAPATPPVARAPAAPARLGALHVPSPDWRDQIIYFVMTDRFADGDPRNNDQGAGEFRPGDGNRYQGGDLRGLTQRLDYIAGLGATALWLTPPVANQWIDPANNYTGFHGYWAEHFKKVDRHLGSLDDYRRLSRALHGRGMYLVQDIVVNHTGNFYTYRDRWNPADAAAGYEPHDRTPPVARPSQKPFDRNDPRDPAQRRDAIYHWTPDVTNYADTHQEHNFQMAGLDDLNTENPVVRRALRDSHGFWIREVGVDAFRVDTAFYVPPAYFADFMHARDPRAPGIAEAARRTGRRDFLVFGEGFAIGKPFTDDAARKIERYMTGTDGQPLMPGMLNFPLYAAFGDVFARGRPTAELAHRITATMALHARPHLMPTFVDNHDVDRFLAGGSVPALRQALVAQFTLPGIPVVYYGTEQGFTEQRAAMFAAGFASGGRDRYDTSAPLYRLLAELSSLRRGDRVFTRGVPTVIKSNAAQPGGLAWRMSHEGAAAVVALNTAEGEALLENMDTGLPAGTVLRGVFGLEGRPADLTVGAGGRLTLALPARGAVVWKAVPAAAAPVAPAEQQLGLQAPPGERLSGDFTVRGQANGVAQVRVVVDGDLARAAVASPDTDGSWQAVVDTSTMVDADVEHTVTAWAQGQVTSPTHRFRIAPDWRLAADAEDPAGDDQGPTGRYLYPTDPGWGEARQMDLRRVRAYTAGGALRLELSTHRVTTTWSPANGFDHVLFTVFIELPGQPGGATVMPLQDGKLPDGLRWHRRLRVGGWSNALFDAAGAGTSHEGTPVAPGAAVQVDKATNTVRLTLPAAALGRLKSLSGARVYVTTWDYDGGYRALAPQPQGYAMGGAEAGSPKVMDASAVITLP